MSKKACLPSDWVKRCILGYFSNWVDMLFLKPALYSMKAIMAPTASPINEIAVPSQKPKNNMLAAVIKKLGITPNNATTMLIKMLISTAAWGYCSNR